MRSETHGTATLEVEVTNISKHGFWVFLDDRELFLPFDEFPWFRNAPVSSILEVERPHGHHLFWPDLDIDLAVESIEHPERYPLKAKATTELPVTETVVYSVGERPGTGRYCCTLCDWTVALDDVDDRLPPCGNCGKGAQATYARC